MGAFDFKPWYISDGTVFVSVSMQKKLPLTTLAQCMVEGAAVLGDESLLG